MKFGIFYELQLPRPWEAGGELKLYQDALTQLETAMRSATRAGWLVVSWKMPWPSRIFLVRWLAAARNDSGDGECEYSSRK